MSHASPKTHQPLLPWLLLVLMMLLPVSILFLLPGGGLFVGGIWFWLALILSSLLVWALAARTAAQAPPAPELRMLAEADQPAVVREILNVHLATEQGGVQIFRGPLREDACSAYEKLKESFSGGTVPLLQADEELGATVILVPRAIEEATLEKPVRAWKHWTLFGLTVLTTTWAGAAHQGVNLLAEPARFAVGLPYSIGLLLILGVHEMGHYVAARRHRMNVTPPYFIPVPLALGTFGAFIRMKSPPENRRALFDMAVAGPLAGLVVAIIALWIGLQSSVVLSVDPARSSGFLGGSSSISSSFLFGSLARVSLGDALDAGNALRLSPLAFAGWLGLLVTALNLLPIGQLDGGHIGRAMFGDRTGHAISTIALWSLVLLAIFVWPGLMMWAILVFFIARRGTPPLNDITPLTTGRRWLGYFSFLVLAMILVPLPDSFWQAAKTTCPYL